MRDQLDLVHGVFVIDQRRCLRIRVTSVTSAWRQRSTRQYSNRKRKQIETGRSYHVRFPHSTDSSVRCSWYPSSPRVNRSRR